MPYYSGKTNERPTILCPCPPPKRLLTSTNWICRNDSSSVNAIFHPEINLVSPRLKYTEKTKGDVIAKHILGKNNCYCRCKNKKLPKPTFFKRPSTCVSYEGTYKSTRSSYEDDLKRESIHTCVCNESQDDLNVPEPLKSRLTRLKQSKSAPEGLKYSDQRKKYGEYREAQEERYADEVQGYRANYEMDLMASKVNTAEGGDSEDIDTILGVQHLPTGTSTSNNDKYGTRTTVSKPSDELDYNSSGEFPTYAEETVPEFRKEHYFETHYIGKVSQMTGDGSKDHVCVHQFKLDRRWLPDPVSKDNFGRSLCKFCDKPMDGSSVNLSSGYLFSEDGLSKSKLKNYADAYQSGLMPKNINLSKGKSKIELVIKESDIPGLCGYFNKSKQPVHYCNSLALRQQRMRLI